MFKKDRVISLLKEKNLSNYKLAKMINVSQAAISGWLNGKRSPKKQNVLLIAKALDVRSIEISDFDDIDFKESRVAGYFQSWSATLNKTDERLLDPCKDAVTHIQRLGVEMQRLRIIVRAFMLTMQSMFYVKNFSGQYILANEPYLKALGLDINYKIVGKTDKDILSDNIAAKIQTVDTSVIIAEKVFINEVVRFPISNSKIKWCVMTKVPLKNDKLETVGMVASFADITRERKLARQEEILRDAVNFTNIPIIVASYKGNSKKNFPYIEYVNESSMKALGHPPDSIKKSEYISWWLKNFAEDDKKKGEDYFYKYDIPSKSLMFKYLHPENKELKHYKVVSTIVEKTLLRYINIYDMKSEV